MKLKTVLLFVPILFLQCGMNKQRNGVKVGKWVYKDTIGGVVSKSKGYYDEKGNEKGVWKQYIEGKLAKKEIYKGIICTTTYYYPNGKIKEMGLTRTDQTQQYINWYYTGDWFYFDENEILKEVRVFEKGLLIEELKIN